MNDHELVSATLAGNDKAFELLMKRYVPLIGNFIRSKTPNTVDSEDLVQEVFIKAYRELSTLKDVEQLGAWLIGIARNAVNDVYRQRNSQKRSVLKRHSNFHDEADALSNIPDTAQGPIEHAEQAETVEQITEALDQVSDTYRMVLYMALFEGCTSREIAAQLGLKESAVRMRLQRGLVALRKHLEASGIIQGEDST